MTRKTVNLDNETHRSLKLLAAQRGIGVNDLIEDFVRFSGPTTQKDSGQKDTSRFKFTMPPELIEKIKKECNEIFQSVDRGYHKPFHASEYEVWPSPDGGIECMSSDGSMYLDNEQCASDAPRAVKEAAVIHCIVMQAELDTLNQKINEITESLEAKIRIGPGHRKNDPEELERVKKQLDELGSLTNYQDRVAKVLAFDPDWKEFAWP